MVLYRMASTGSVGTVTLPQCLTHAVNTMDDSLPVSNRSQALMNARKLTVRCYKCAIAQPLHWRGFPVIAPHDVFRITGTIWLTKIIAEDPTVNCQCQAAVVRHRCNTLAMSSWLLTHQ